MSTALAVHHGVYGRIALYNVDRDMVLHAHREGHLIFHVQGPAARIRVDEALLPLSGGSAVAISPWQLHDFQSLAPGPSLFLILYVRPLWFLEASRQPCASLHFGRNRIEVTAPVARLAVRIVSCLLDEAGEDWIEGLLGELTQACFDQSWQWDPADPLADVADERRGGGLRGLLAGQNEGQSEGRNEGQNGSQAAGEPCGSRRSAPVAGRLRIPAPRSRTIRDFRVRNSVRLIQDALARTGLGERLALDEVARAAGLSRPHFYKLFREQLGITPNTYLNTLRMERAIDRLVGSPDSVTEIGLDLGFSSQASFTRFFIANVGITPSSYRRVAQAAPAPAA